MCSLTMKYCRKPGVALSASTYQGAATTLASTVPLSQGSARRRHQFLVSAIQAPSESPTNTTATGPFARQPNPSARKKASPHHLRLRSPVPAALAKSAKHIKAPLTLAERAISSTHEPANTKNKPDEARINPASAPTRLPHRARPKAIVPTTIRTANKKFGRRAAHSDGPNAPNDIAVVQKNRGGLAQNGTSSPDM